MEWEKQLGRIFPFALIIAALMVLGGLKAPAWGDEVLKTRYAVVRATSAADLVEMERHLRFNTATPVSQPAATGALALNPSYSRLAAKIDGILERTAAILRLTSARTYRVNIVLLPNGKAVRQQHVLMVSGQRPGLFGYGSLEAFYAVWTRTVYLSLADVREGILAHEFTHHLLCTVMTRPIPERDQEAYAHYVESRL
jgi:hypothetical protein